GIRDFHVTGVQTCALPIYVVAAIAMANNLEAIWVDYKRSISSKNEIFIALVSALRLYWSDFVDANWSELVDQLLDPELMPEKGCILFFGDLSLLKKNQNAEYKILLSQLEYIADTYKESKTYKFVCIVNESRPKYL